MCDNVDIESLVVDIKGYEDRLQPSLQHLHTIKNKKLQIRRTLSSTIIKHTSCCGYVFVVTVFSFVGP